MKAGTLNSCDDSGTIRRGVVSAQGRSSAPIVLFTPYGVIHNPPPGCLVMMHDQLGQDSNLMGIADDPKNRSQKGLASGEVGLENYLTQTYIILRENGDIEISCENDVRIVKSTNVIVDASSSVTVNCPSITLNGNVTIAGTLTQTGGGAATFSGNIVTPADVVADGISLNSHVHSGVTPGGGNTGGPV